MISLILSTLLVGYVVLLNVYLYGWRKEVGTQAPPVTGKHIVSIIVPARNERESIALCIRTLLSQDYQGEFEVILVDDHSEDGTLETVRRLFGEDERLSIISQEPDLVGKKAALATGIDRAKGDIIATIDADCAVGPSWLRTFISEFEYGVQIATGAVLIRDAQTDLEVYQALDLMSLTVVTAGGLNLGMHVLGNGANLMFRKSAFDKVGGYRSGAEYASGDDLFLLQAIAEEYGNEAVAYVASDEGAVWTGPEHDHRDLMEQRVRWASKNGSLPDKSIQAIWAFIWCVNVASLSLIAFVLANSITTLFAVIFIGIKAAQEYAVLSAVAKHYDLGAMLRRFPVAFAMNIIYITVIGLKALTSGEYSWKGRTVR